MNKNDADASRYRISCTVARCLNPVFRSTAPPKPQDQALVVVEGFEPRGDIGGVMSASRVSQCKSGMVSFDRYVASWGKPRSSKPKLRPVGG